MQGKNIPSNQSEGMFFIFIETFYRNFFSQGRRTFNLYVEFNYIETFLLSYV